MGNYGGRRKTRILTYFFLSTSSVLTVARPSIAQHVNFQFAPSPIPNADWVVGRIDRSFSGLFNRQTGSGFHFSGGGADYSFREPLDARLAWGGNWNFLVMTGQMNVGPAFGEVGALYKSIKAGLNLQRQVLRERTEMTFMAGLDLHMAWLEFGEVRSHPSGAFLPEDIMIVMMGAPVGIGAGQKLGSRWRMMPYLMVVPYFAGSATARIQGWEVAEKGIDPFFTITAGSDLLYLPWDLSLGAIWQETTSSGNNRRISLVSFQVGWVWSEEIAERRR